ncbi:MAG TPA: LuxR family transcriptional regulator [Phenylobacterium sp.]|jgi:LuxR family quorum-sensing system transcriptional regulator CciR
MSAFADVEQFVKAAGGLTRMEDLAVLLTDAADTLGFAYVALVHHVNVTTPEAAAQAVQVVRYPEAWHAVVEARGYFADDPVLAACQRSAAAFLWSELPRLLPLSSRQTEILESASACGLAEGFTVPVNVPGEFMGSCSFGVATGQPLLRRALPAAQYVGCFAFEAARRIQRIEARSRQVSGNPHPRLTQRQFDCVVLAAQGRSDWHIAQLLGISPDTVHQHIETAKRRFGVASRTELVVRALFDSQITFADILR